MWWMRMLPLAVDRTRVTLGFCFPRATVELPHFDEVFERYKVRWATAVGEDNGISANQQAGLRSPHRRPGRFTPLGEAEHCVCGASGAAAPAFLADRHGCGVFARHSQSSARTTSTTGCSTACCRTSAGTRARTRSALARTQGGATTTRGSCCTRDCSRRALVVGPAPPSRGCSKELPILLQPSSQPLAGTAARLGREGARWGRH